MVTLRRLSRIVHNPSHLPSHMSRIPIQETRSWQVCHACLHSTDDVALVPTRATRCTFSQSALAQQMLLAPGHASHWRFQSLWKSSGRNSSLMKLACIHVICTPHHERSLPWSYMGLAVPDDFHSDWISNEMHVLEPEAFAGQEPTAKKVHRVALVALGPHHQWSGDRHDKLVKIGFPVWGIRDMWEGKWLGLWTILDNALRSPLHIST